MTKPTEDPTWATDTNYTADGDPWSGSPTKVTPSLSRRKEGAEPDTFPAQWYNYTQNAHGKHIEYIHGVLEASDTIPAVTRTLRVGASEFTLDGSAEDRDRRIRVTASSGYWASGTTGNSLTRGTPPAATFLPRMNDVNGRFMWEIGHLVPQGALITYVSALVDPGVGQATAADRIQLRVNSWIPSGASPGAITNHAAVAFPDATATINEIVASGLSIRNNRQSIIEVHLKPGVGVGTTPDDVHGLEIRYDGPRFICGGSRFTASADYDRVWIRNPEGAIQGEAILPLNRYVPEGATITAIRTLVRPGAARAVSQRVNAELWLNSGRDYSVGSPAIGGATSVSSVEDDGTTNLQTLNLSGLSYVMDQSAEDATLVVGGGILDFDPDELFGCEIDFTDPGPRNF